MVVPAFKAMGARVVGYGSHVDAARLKAARKAGCDEVLPRSAFFEGLETRLRVWGESITTGLSCREDGGGDGCCDRCDRQLPLLYSCLHGLSLITIGTPSEAGHDAQRS